MLQILKLKNNNNKKESIWQMYITVANKHFIELRVRRL